MKELKKNPVGRPKADPRYKTKPVTITLQADIIAMLSKERNKSRLVQDLLIKHYKL